jgi:plasmid stabilization system protein ParE
MGRRKIVVKESAAESIAAVALFIESKGFPSAAERFADGVYDYFLSMADNKKSYAVCREPGRSQIGYKCLV